MASRDVIKTPSSLMKSWLAWFGLLLFGTFVCPISFDTPQQSRLFYDFNALNMDGKLISMEQYRGHVVLVVNLQELYTTYADQGLRILAFPCNQFGGQEPGTNEEIKQFVVTNYQVSFDFFDKVDVNGPDAHPIFAYLQESLPGLITNSIKWNFSKFLIDRHGRPHSRYSPTTDPKDMESDIKKLLAAS
nr:unnamed protein product [Spirometra erinaceieuropaei]